MLSHYFVCFYSKLQTQIEEEIKEKQKNSRKKVSVLMGSLNLCYRRRHKRKLKQFQRVEIKVKMDCEGCERRVRKSVEGMKGVSNVTVDPKQSKLTVEGFVQPSKVVHRVMHRTGKKAELWPYVPYEVVPHPYAPGAYDKKAPPGYVRNALADPLVAPLARASSSEVKYTSAFSDDNPNACTIM